MPSVVGWKGAPVIPSGAVLMETATLPVAQKRFNQFNVKNDPHL